MIKNAFNLYRYHFWRIVFIGLIIVLPVQFLFSFFVNYTSFPFQTFGLPIWTNLIQIFFLLMSLCLIQLPYISISIQDNRFDEVSLKKVLGDTITYMFPVYLISIIYALLAVVGTILFVVPGIVAIILFIGLSQAAIIEDQTGFKGMKRAFLFGKNRFMAVFGLVFAFAIVDFFISGFGYTVAAQVTNSILMANITLMVLNMFVLPLFIFMMTSLYIQWKTNRSHVLDSKNGIDPYEENVI